MDEKLQSLRSLIDGMLFEATAAQLRKEYRRAERIMAHVERLEQKYDEQVRKEQTQAHEQTH